LFVATEVTLPKASDTAEEGTIVEWYVNVGDQVEAEEPLCELVSDKNSLEILAPVSGVLKEIKVQVHETVPVGTVVALIRELVEEDTAATRTCAEADKLRVE
jgi:pyruvate/2-oxoglutarate dehydrogenase complex dihydrolipoamide acyltransferase (E2) component